MSCPKHPKYRGLRRPRKEPICPDCLAFYEQNKAEGKIKLYAKKIPAKIEEPEQVESPVEQEASCDECSETVKEETYDDVLKLLDGEELE